MKKVMPAIFLLMLFFTRCTTTRMALTDPDWQKPAAYLVDNKNPLFRKQSLAFGNFATTEINRSWTKGTSYNTTYLYGGISPTELGRLISIERSYKKQTLRFSLQDDKANNSSVYCLANARTKDLVLGNNTNSALNIAMDLLSIGIESENKFFALIRTDPQSKAWELLLDNQAAQRTKGYSGSLAQDPENYYTIMPVNKLEGNNGPVTLPFGTIGFEFRNKEGKPVAALSLLDKGVVYLNDVPESERFLLANACAAILLRPVIE
jgi:hypothetical protein